MTSARITEEDACYRSRNLCFLAHLKRNTRNLRIKDASCSVRSHCRSRDETKYIVIMVMVSPKIHIVFYSSFCLINQVVKYLQETLDVEVNRNTLRRMRHAVALWSAKMTVDDEESFTSLLGTNGSRVIPLLELVKRMVGLSSHTVPAIALALTENINHMWPTQTTRLMNSCDKLLDEIQNVLGDDGVLIYPSHPKLAPFHNAPLMYPTNFAHTGLFNALNLPATQVPLGLSAQGIPLGIQVVANRHNDHLCLAVARELERGFGGWATQLGMGQYHQIIEDGADHSG